MNILYIHGLGSDKNSKTGKAIKDYFETDNANHVFVKTFDLTNPQKAMVQVRMVLNKENINLIIASSLGAFYALQFKGQYKIIVMNPCLFPTVELPKLEVELDNETESKFEKLERNIFAGIDNEVRAFTFGAFASNDELFSYRRELMSNFGKKSTFNIGGGHRVSGSNLISVLNKGLKYLEVEPLSITPVPIFEQYVNLIAGHSDSKKTQFEKYKDEVYNILVDSYANIGGMLGVENADDLIEDSSFWKLEKKGGKVISVALYVTKRGGRKLILCGTDGTEAGKKSLTKILIDDIKFPERQAWVESSYGLERKMIKLGAVPIPAEVVKLLMPDKEIMSIDEDGFHYERMIGGKKVKKITFGNINV